MLRLIRSLEEPLSLPTPKERSVRFRLGILGLLGPVIIAASLPDVCAQEPISAEGETVVINCPEQLELRVMVDYVGKAVGVRFLYGEELDNQRVELRPSPVELPRKHLLTLLSSLLRVRDLAMVEESPGFYRIVRADQTTRSVSTILPAESRPSPESLRMVTHVLTVPSGNVKAVGEQLKPFLSSRRGGLVSVPENGVLIVTDYESRLALLRELIAILDVVPAKLTVRQIAVTGAEPATVATQVSAILTESCRLQKRSVSPPSVRGDILPGAVVLIGTVDQVKEAAALIERFTPAPVELSTHAHTPRYLSLDRVERLIEKVVLAPGSGLVPPAAVYTDQQGGRLFVTADGPTQAAIAAMLEEEDRPVGNTRRPLRIYRPKHRKAGDLLGTLSQLLGEGAEVTMVPAPGEGVGPEGPVGPPGPNRPPSRPGAGQVPPMPPAQEPRQGELPPARSRIRVQGPDYILTEDEHTNAILAIGTREFHAQVESLIEDLDRRRPQVMIEMTLVGVTMSDTLDLGVELASKDLGDAWDYLLFSSFGLSSIDAITGQRTLMPGVGFNGVVIRPDEVPIVIQALATRGGAKVISTPKLLVADNARATLRNVDEAPFTSVNASDTVATTSFAGFESAGTTLSVTPHISEGDHITLEYEMTFSNFVGTSGDARIPPPRTTNSFTSTVEVPDGHTVITGGLVVDNDSETISEVPFLGRIPVLGVLFQSSARQKTKTKIFAFIRPTILRDDEFEDLKYISLKDIEAAEIHHDNPPPPGEPQWMH